MASGAAEAGRGGVRAGASILAAEGGEVMAVVQVAMRAGLPYTALRDMVFAHPTMAEGLNDLFERLE
jgi:pyruvate/2-oxoglutarate dehydrogenase complex dihydrolipoamide dehydrogenase (E3) component